MSQVVKLTDFSGGVTDTQLNGQANKAKTCDNLLIKQTGGTSKLVTRQGCEVYPSRDTYINGSAIRGSNHAVGYDRALFFNSLSAEKIFRISDIFIWQGVAYFHCADGIFRYSPGLGWKKDTSLFLSDLTYSATGKGTPDSLDAVISIAQWSSTPGFLVDGTANEAGVYVATLSSRCYPKTVYSGSTQAALDYEVVGLGSLTASTITTNAAAGSAGTWLYKFVRRRNKTVYNVDYVYMGPPSLAKTVSSSLTDIANVTLSGFPTNPLTNPWVDDIYRTVKNGSVFYLVGTLDSYATISGARAFLDNVSDAVLQTKQTLYTEGGIAPNNAPPKCKIVHSLNGYMYYANIEDAYGDVLNNRLLQSKPNQYYAVPETFYLDFPEEIVAVTSIKNNLIVLCTSSAYRVDGNFDELGRGEMVAERISNTVSCVSSQGAVQVPGGVLWAGKEGIFFTEGVTAFRVNEDSKEKYSNYVNTSGDFNSRKASFIHGKYDKKNNRVWWAVKSSDSSIDNDYCYIMDLNFGISPTSTFTTASGGNYFGPTALAFVDGSMLRADSQLNVFLHKDEFSTDFQIPIPAAPAYEVISLAELKALPRKTIIYDYETCATDFGAPETRKYTTTVNISCSADSFINLQVTSNSDDGRVVEDMLPVRSYTGILWGHEDIYWGDPYIAWNPSGVVSKAIKMPKKSLRCNFKSFKLSNAKSAIVNSDRLGLAYISVNNTAELTGAEWPTNSIGYFLAFEDDGYITEYPVTQYTGSTLEFTVPRGAVVPGDKKWVLRGYAKGESLGLLGLALTYELFGPTHDSFTTADSNEVGS